MGTNNGLLYGVISANNGFTCPNSGSPNTNVLCFYTTSNISNESWTYRGQYQQWAPSNCGSNCIEYPIELVFAPTTCNSNSYKYLYTGQNRILRATSDPNDWSFTVVGAYNLPNFPSNGATRPASFAIGTNNSGGMRLYYGNYRSDGLANSFVWYSDTCGNTWSNPPLNLGGSEVHDIRSDPGNPMNIYVVVDDENQQNNLAQGLWLSTDGGYPPTFTHLGVSGGTNNSTANGFGINFVISDTYSKLFFEPDGTGATTTGGPLVSFNMNGTAFQIAAPWPAPTPTAWSGAGGAIKLTSEQNIFDATEGETTFRSGLWYFAPPYYNAATLLEDLAPPISNIGCSGNGVAIVTTFAPHGIQAFDAIQIQGTFTEFDTQNLIPVSVTGSTTFTYQTDGGCTPGDQYNWSTSPGGYVFKNFDWVHHVTFEVTDPTTNVTYLYHDYHKFPKPQFLIWDGSGEIPGDTTASTTSPMIGGVTSYGQTYILNPNSLGHLEAVTWLNNSWQATDLSVTYGDAWPSPYSPMIQAAAGSFYYIDTQGRVNGVYAPTSPGGQWNGSGPIPAPAAATGSPLAGFINSSGVTYLLYQASNGHLQAISYVGGWQTTDLSVTYGAAWPKSQIVQIAPGNFYYFDGNGIINGVYGPGSNGVWYFSGPIPMPAAASGSPLAGFINSSGTTYLLYQASNSHLEAISYVGSWQTSDLSVTYGAAWPKSQIVQIASGNFYYFDGNRIINGVYGPGSDGVWHFSGPLPMPAAAVTSPLNGFVSNSGITYLLYTTSGNQAETVTYVNGGWVTTNLSQANGTAPPVSPIIQATPGSLYYIDGNKKINGVYAPTN